MSPHMVINALSGLIPGDEPGSWSTQGEQPPLLALAPRPGRPSPGPGWYRLRLRILRVASDQDARLILRPANGSPQRTMRLPVAINGLLDHVFKLPFKAAALELQPFSGTGAVRLDRVRLEKISHPTRLSLMLGRVALYLHREGGMALLRSLEQMPLAPDVTMVADCSPLETMYRLIKRRMVLRSLPVSEYPLWVEHVEPRETVPTTRLKPGAAPRFSVLLPLRDDSAAAQQSLQSLARQGLLNFECLLAYGPGLEQTAAALLAHYSFVRAVPTEDGSAAGLVSAALEQARGDFMLCLPPGDRLASDALAWFAAALENDPDLAVLYSDEDRLGPDGQRCAPLFKPDWDPELLPAFNFMGPTFLCSVGLARGVELAQGLGLLALLYHLALETCQSAGAGRIGHVPRILAHRGGGDCSGRRAEEMLHVAQGYCTRHRPGFRVLPAASTGLRRLVPPPPAQWPWVSAIIPTRDGLEVLRPCLEGLLAHTDYPRLEILVADNGSTDPATLEYLRELEASGAIRVLRLEMPFNWSRLNNLSVRQARGEVLVFLNNDVEVLQPDWLRQLTTQALRPEIGAVGALLLYPNGLVQHAGVVLGLGGLAGHPHKGSDPEASGPWTPLCCTRSTMAVTGACLAVRREVFDQVGGFEEQLAVAYNDVDFCLRVTQTWRRVLWTPEVVLRHHESFTRGRDSGWAQSRRFNAERAFMRARWWPRFGQDPYYNANLTCKFEDCGLACFPDAPR